MKIAAMRIPKGYLPHIFGEEHEEVTINLGGRNIYTFETNGSIVTTPNEFYLDDIFSSNISLFSCIVGGNGGGKTSLLQLILNEHNCDFILEYDNGDYKLAPNLEKIHRVYFTPYLNHSIFDTVGNNGKELSKVALIKMDNHGDGGQLDDFLEVHHSENCKRWIKFNNFYRKKEISKILLPKFKKVELAIKHFECNIVTPNKFNDTSYQLRPAIIFVFAKINAEQKVAEGKHFSSKGDVHDEMDLSYFKVRFEYSFYETILGKLVAILERAGNLYLEEGYIPDDYENQMKQMDVRSAFEWFLLNSGVYRAEKKYSFSKNLVMLDLLDFVRSLITPESLTDNWLKIIVTEEDTLKVIELSDAFTNSFINGWFKYNSKPIFGYLPLISVSSGEQQFLNLFSVLHYHAENIKNRVNIDVHSFNSLKHVKKDILLLLDEADNAFHPQWKKEYVNNLRKILPVIFEGYNIQIIITSHDPLTLSDFPKNNVVFLEKGGTGTIVSNSNTKHTFGANISDLLKDSFFLQDSQIGGFVAEKIDETILEIRKGDINLVNKQKLERIIRAIDEPIIKFKLAEMLNDTLGDNQFERELLDNEIIRLQEKRNLI